MPAFETLSPEETLALVHYARSLGTFRRPPEDEAALEALAARYRTAARRVPDRIPVSAAIARLVREAPAAETPPGLRRAARSGILARAIRDREAAAAALAASPRWRSGPAELARQVVRGAPGNGFSASVLAFSASDWKALHEELRR